MASKKRIGRKPRPRFTPQSGRRSPDHQRSGTTSGTCPGGSGRHGEPLWAIEPSASVRVMRVPFTPHPGLAAKDRRDLWELIQHYGNTIIGAGRHAGRAFEQDGVIYLQADKVLRRFEPLFAQMGTLGTAVEVEVPEGHA